MIDMKAHAAYSKSLEGFANFLAEVRTGLVQQTMKQETWNLAQKAGKLVRQRYRSYKWRPSTHLPGPHPTLAGKRKGAVRPPRKPRSFHNPPLDMLARAVEVKRMSRGYTVRIDPKARHPDARLHFGRRGAPLSLVAYWVENPKPYIVPVTLRMLAYLKTVRLGKKTYGSRRKKGHLPDKRTRYYFSVVPPDRPVWSAVAKDMYRLRPLMNKRVKAKLDALTRKHGGQVIQ